MSLQGIISGTWRRVPFQTTLTVVTAIVIFYACTIAYLSKQQNIVNRLLSRGDELILEDELIKRPLTTLRQDDPKLIQMIRTKYLNPPSRLSYNLKGQYGSVWQAGEVKNLLNEKRNGFYIECGAYNGEFLSNTLMFEKDYEWEGLLIEADPSLYEELISKNRKAWTVPACLSINDYPSEAMMKKVWNIEGDIATYSIWKITNDPIQQDIKDVNYKVQCFPLYSILLALNRTKVDYLSLDVEGNELNIFKTIPWDKVNITVVSAEFNHVDQGKDALREYMESKGYKVYIDGGTLNTLQNIDFIFYHPNLLNS